MRRAGVLGALVLIAACRGHEAQPAAPAARPSILIVTLDTTRADAIGPEARGVSTPAFNAVAARGRRFAHAYATVPETLPSHASMMTGLYPAGHGVHENARALPGSQVALAERMKQAGYQTAAFVSSYVLGRQFGLAQGFDVYDDAPAVERAASDTTDRAIAFLNQAPAQVPLLVWVHYFEPHTPYAPPEPFKTQYAANPYLGEVAAMDQQLGRLIEAFEARAAQSATQPAIVIAADHGEGLGDHGERQHGHLLYQSTMKVPMVMAGPGIEAGVVETPVSTRRIFHTVLDWAGVSAELSLRGGSGEVVLGEAMKPYLEYGWQPQIMAIEGRRKAIFAGRTEIFDLAADPGETTNLGSGGNIPPAIRKALDDYPVPTPGAARPPENLSAEAQRNLASLGYVSATATPVVRRDAPRPVDMVGLFDEIERASTLFVRGEYAQAIPVLQAILAKDPHNLDAALRLATSYSSLRRHAQAVEMFRKAASIAPDSPDVRLYLALHYARTDEWPRALSALERLAPEMPDRAVAWEALGELAMRAGRTDLAIQAFERTRGLLGAAFRHDLELGVLYLAARRLPESRQSLDRVLAAEPQHPMALFKRAQLSALLGEPDTAARIAAARRHADATTRELIAREQLFK